MEDKIRTKDEIIKRAKLSKKKSIPVSSQFMGDDHPTKERSLNFSFRGEVLELL